MNFVVYNKTCCDVVYDFSDGGYARVAELADAHV